jgi:hypothetical protein
MAALRFLLVAAMCLATASAFMAPASLKLGARSAVVSRCALAPAIRQPAKTVLGLTMQEDDPLKLFVGGLPWALTSDDLREVFAEFGSITEANVVYDRETGRSRGFGFVAFTEEASASSAVQSMDQAEIGGRTINVKFAKKREPFQRR